MVLKIFQKHRGDANNAFEETPITPTSTNSSSSNRTKTKNRTKKKCFWHQAADEIADFQRLLANKERRKNFVDLMFMNQEELIQDLNNGSSTNANAKEAKIQVTSGNNTATKDINQDTTTTIRSKKSRLLEVFVDGSSTDLELEEEDEEEEEEEAERQDITNNNSKKSSFLGSLSMLGLRKPEKDDHEQDGSCSSASTAEECTALVAAKPAQHQEEEDNKKQQRRNIWEEIHHDCTRGDKKILRAIGRTALVNSVVAAAAFTGGAVTGAAGFATGGAITAKRFGDGLKEDNPLEVTKSLAVYGSATTASVTGQAVAGTLMIAVAGATIPVAAAVAFGVGCTSGIAAGALSEWGVDHAYQTSVQQLSPSNANATKAIMEETAPSCAMSFGAKPNRDGAVQLPQNNIACMNLQKRSSSEQ